MLWSFHQALSQLVKNADRFLMVCTIADFGCDMFVVISMLYAVCFGTFLNNYVAGYCAFLFFGHTILLVTCTVNGTLVNHEVCSGLYLFVWFSMWFSIAPYLLKIIRKWTYEDDAMQYNTNIMPVQKCLFQNHW